MTADERPAKVRQSSADPIGEPAQFSIGADVSCSDGVCGELARVIVDPVARALTHLVVKPKHHRGLGRLVPVELVEPNGEQIRLRCTTAQFEQLEDAQETHFLPISSDQWGYGPGHALAWPYYGAGLAGGMGGMGMVGGMGMAGGMGGMLLGVEHAHQPVVSDRVPLGEVEIQRGDTVHASDGEIGSVQGLVIGPQDRHVTHVLLQEGHLWGRKQVAIPIGAVTSVTDGILVQLTKQQVHDLPAVDLSLSP